MQNLDQLRAAHALAWVNTCNPNPTAPTLVRRDAAKLPAMLLTNGLLAAFAFACEAGKDPRAGLAKVCTGIARHLADPTTGFPELAGQTDPDKLADKLSKSDALVLQRATTEALAYLAYLKRYAPKKDNGTGE
jgi:CRISPR/Cas system CMR-associated protein Cmr5 small subunit